MISTVLSFDQTYDILVLCVAVIATIAGLNRWVVRPLVRADEARAKTIASVVAEEATAPILRSMEMLDVKLTTIQAEVQTNGGKSLKDVVLKTRERQVILDAKFDQHMQEAHDVG